MATTVLSRPRARALTASIGRLDVALALAATAGGVLLMLENLGWSEIDMSRLAVPAIVAVTLPVLWRNARPLEAAAVLVAAVTVHAVLFGSVVRCGIVYPVTWLLAYSAGARLDRREARIGLGLVLAAQLAMSLSDAVLGPEVNVLFWPITGAVWVLGRVVHNRDGLVLQLRDRTAELRQARDDRARLEVATDRARLSGELDHLLQRRLGDLARLADAGAAATEATTARTILVEIETASRRTLDEMRTVVGVLRHDEGAPTAPQPTLTHLETLLVRAKGAGARLRVEGNPRVLPAGVELSAYRVVEHLLAALDDAGDVEVCVRFGDDALELVVSGPARRRAEAAIERARARVELHRGTLVASTRGGHAEAVAHLPVLAGL